MQDPTGQKEETAVTGEFYVTGEQPMDPFLCPSYLKRNCNEKIKLIHKRL
jgi:hypothetical protein